jgi:hypothetical protein
LFYETQSFKLKVFASASSEPSHPVICVRPCFMKQSFNFF